ncbi:phage tail assembly chaperone [Lactobacillus intestinalis]|uniref:phage tail assembly chaperone n=1 Tax=Lactobacillus intestinalis TaxID=151781 RepID=UPI00272EC250|nr:hypothetical protein [Lactobacillus intestinalis]
MSKFSCFMKQSKILKENTTYAPTKSLLDEHGEPVKFTIRALTTKENEKIKEVCTIDVPVKGKPNVFRQRLDSNKYISKIICACVIEPNLLDKDLQDSYGVYTPEELIQEMIDDPAEYQKLAWFVQDYNGFDIDLNEKVEEAKN